jgi:hypothetical protein
MLPDLESFWSQLKRDILGTDYPTYSITNLALSWGMKSPLPESLQVGDVLKYSSLSEFQAYTPGIGKTKVEIIGRVLWRLWSEISPQGPAGPPPSAPSIQAQNIRKNLGKAAKSEIIISVVMNLANLSPQAISILQERYGLRDGEARTLEAIGEARQVTRERIRQIEEGALNSITRHLVAKNLLQLYLEESIGAVLKDLVYRNGSPLLRLDHPVRNCLHPSFRFLVDRIYGSLDQFLQELEVRGRAIRTPVGWWLGGDLGNSFQMDYEKIVGLMESQERPLAIKWLAEKLKILPVARVCDILSAHSNHQYRGIVFPGRPTAAEKRSLLAVRTAREFQKSIWFQPDLFRHSKSFEPTRASSYRLFCRDLGAIPGFVSDSPGPYVVVNPLAADALIYQTADDESDLDEAGIAHESEGFGQGQDGDSEAFTLVDKIRSLFEGRRLIKYENLEEAFSRREFGNPVISLGPILITSDSFVRYAPGYYGVSGLRLTEEDLELLCNESDVTKFVISKRGGGLQTIFPFWTPELEFAMSRWAEQFGSRSLFESLLTVIEPENWPVPAPVQQQWVAKRRKQGVYRLSPPEPDFLRGVVDFSIFYGLTMLAIERGNLGYAAISQFCGWGYQRDRRSLTIMAVLIGIGVLQPRMEIDLPHLVSDDANNIAHEMSSNLFENPEEIENSWFGMLSRELEARSTVDALGWFNSADLLKAKSSWTLASPK